MKLKSNIQPRRNGAHAKAEIAGKTYEGDKEGVYDVPEDVAEILLDTGNFETMDGKKGGGKGGRGGKKGGKDKPVILEGEDGKKVNLSEMDRDALVTFATEFGLDLLESELDKDGVIAAIMAKVAEAEEDE